MIYSVTSMESLIRSELNESTTVRISSTEILNAINDGYTFVATRGLCYEKDTLIVTTSGSAVFPRPGLKVKAIEMTGYDGYIYFADDDMVWTDDDMTFYKTAATALTDISMACVLPTNIGYLVEKGTAPQHWFNWGEYIVVSPTPDNRYILKVYYADYPTALTLSTDELLIPKEFHRCVVDFAESMLCIKLRRWTEVAVLYNKCTSGIQKAMGEYIKRVPDIRALREMPTEVKNG